MIPRQVPPPPPQLRPQPCLVDPKIWRACAGRVVQIHTVNSRVYYFPQGHMDEASPPPQNISPLLLSKPCILCTVTAVQFLADRITDEVFAKLTLQPLVDTTAVASPPPVPNPAAAAADDLIVSFSKFLSRSDATGFITVPLFCADAIFPAPDLSVDPSEQTLKITDVHGKAWEFRHLYRHVTNRHSLSTGWRNFVDNKKLVADDSVVFMKNSRKEMFIGIRRAARSAPPVKRPTWFPPIEGVAEAAELAAQNMPFEVLCYPKAGPRWSDFVVKAEVVDEAMGVAWRPGMIIKMRVDTDDPSKFSWYRGMVFSLSTVDNYGPWQGSPWRMLQIAWDDPGELKNSKWFSPWQVQVVTPALHAAFPPTKKFRAAEGSEMSTDGGGEPFSSMTGFTNSTMGHLNQTLLSDVTSPAGMQGARHDQFSVSSFSNFLGDNSTLSLGNSYGNNTLPRLKTLSTELNVGISQSDDLSSDSQSSLPSFGTEFDQNQNHSCSSTKPGTVSFPLFGALIQTEQPVESSSHGAGCIGDDDSSKGCDETKGIGNPLDDSFTYLDLLDRVDGIGQCQGASTVENFGEENKGAASHGKKFNG